LTGPAGEPCECHPSCKKCGPGTETEFPEGEDKCMTCADSAHVMTPTVPGGDSGKCAPPTAAATASTTAATTAAQSFSYATHGSDWNTKPGYEDCGNKGGSPINLNTNFKDYKEYTFKQDELSIEFTNQKQVKIMWDPAGLATKMELATTPNTF
jgi:hypothetical protein